MIVVLIPAAILSLALIGLLAWALRPEQWNRKAHLERHLLVEENGAPAWRTVRARYLVGWPDNQGELASGLYILSENRDKDKPYGHEWAVLETKRGGLIAYQVSDRTVDDHKIGAITVCRSWGEFEQAVPAKLFAEAAIAAGRLFLKGRY
jgi:hypothetical protein